MSSRKNQPSVEAGRGGRKGKGGGEGGKERR